MSVSFNFDERGLRKAVEGAAKNAVADAVRKNQAMFDRVHQRYSGQSKAIILAALRTETHQLGWSATDRDLDEYARAIADGTRIVVQPGNMRW